MEKNKRKRAIVGPLLVIMDNNKISFPTIGEFVREIFNASGLMAQKDGCKSLLTDSEKKSLQTKLKRLADESSRIDGKLEELLTLLDTVLLKTFSDEKVVWVILECVVDLLETYKAVLIDDGTYLPTNESIEWFIKTYALDRLIKSLYKHYLRFNLEASKLDIPPLTHWALPRIENDKIELPLRNAWKLVYESLSLSQSSFHYPDKSVEDFKASRNLENAQHWCATEQIPSINSLFSNLEYSLDLLKNTENKDLQREVSDIQIKRLKIILFIGRVASYCFREIHRHFGKQFLEQCVSHIKSQSNRLSRINRKLSLRINSLKHSHQLSKQAELDYLYFHETECFWRSHADYVVHGSNYLQQSLENGSFSALSPRQKAKFAILCIGSLDAYVGLAHQVFEPDIKNIPLQFPEFLHKGLILKRNPKSLADIDEYVAKLESAGLKHILSWLPDWCYANYFYRQKEFDKSHEYYRQAFRKAKYSAGKNQYLLVNQYIEACAKNSNFKEMKQAVAWAQYLGIKVRWLRGWDDPESEESLKALYSLMGNHRMQYAQL